MKETMMLHMKQAISNVLELMFFQSVQFNEKDCLLSEWMPPDQSHIAATLRFTGPVSGAYYFIVPVDMAKEITANFLGLDENEISDAQERDTVKEALNMIGGHMLSLLDKPEGFQLGIPEIVPEPRLDMKVYTEKIENVTLIETDKNHLAACILLD
jgi:chemotaxis protein CheY-P-specific phosphatase CheC